VFADSPIWAVGIAIDRLPGTVRLARSGSRNSRDRTSLLLWCRHLAWLVSLKGRWERKFQRALKRPLHPAR